jgi:glycosyltransferase involved in cell wall biosynthesis
LIKRTVHLEKNVAFFPSAKQLAFNPYWLMLSSALGKEGVEVIGDTPRTFSYKWLFNNRQRIGVLHLNFIQKFYASNKKGRTRLINVFLFGLKMLVARLLGFRTIFTLHDLEPMSRLQPVWLDNLGHWMAVKFSDRVIVHCGEARRLLAQKYGRRRKVFEVDHPNYIDFYPNLISRDLARKQLGIPDDVIVFSFIGGYRPNKGIESVIQAFSNLKGDKFRLTISGNASYHKKYAQSLIKLAEGDDRISFNLERIPDEDLQVFLNSADILVFPFSEILTSGSTILAMSFERPVIVPRMGCFPALIEPDAGWLFEPNDLDSLTHVMRSAALSDFREFGKSALKKVVGYTPERFAKQTIQAYWS